MPIDCGRLLRHESAGRCPAQQTSGRRQERNMSHDPKRVGGVRASTIAVCRDGDLKPCRRKLRADPSPQHRARSASRLSEFTVVLVILVAASADMLADGWKVQLQGVKALGLSYAGRSIVLDDASTVWFNSAGMTRLKGVWTITSAAPRDQLSTRLHRSGVDERAGPTSDRTLGCQWGQNIPCSAPVCGPKIQRSRVGRLRFQCSIRAG